MNGTKGKQRHIFRKLFAIVFTMICIFSAMPLEAAASAYQENKLTYQQIDAFVNEDGSEKVALDGMIPVNASVTAEPQNAENDTVLCSYDITILKDGTAFQPSAKNPITVEITNTLITAAVANDHPLELWHIHDDGTKERIQNFTVTDGILTFDAFGFSVYEVVDGNPPICTYSFYAPDSNGTYQKYYFPLDSGDIAYQQSVKDGEMLVVPQLPSVPTANSTFLGWFVYDETKGLLSDTPVDFTKAMSVTKNSNVTLRAVYSDCAYIIFHEQYNALKGSWPIVATRRGALSGGETSIPIDDVVISYDDSVTGEEHQANAAPHMIFRGWSRTPVQKAGDFAELVDSPYTIEENVDLYPVFSHIRWLTFQTEEGGSYIAPKYYYLGETGPSSLEVPKRTGYSFEGWYTAANGGGTRITDATGKVVLNGNVGTALTGASGRLNVKEDTTLYAKWAVADSHYTVIVWKQSLNDRYDAASKTYDFYSASGAISAKTGSTVSVNNTYQNYVANNPTDFKGFYYSHCDEAKKVAGNGSTVLNVYYDRCTVIYYWDPDTTWDKVGAITGLYGQPLSQYGYSWPKGGPLQNHIYKFNKTNGGITYLHYFNSIDTGKNGVSDYNEKTHTYTTEFINDELDTEYKVVHHLQLVDGSYSNTDPAYCLETNSNSQGLNFSHKFEPEFYVAYYSLDEFVSDPSKDAKIAEVGKSSENCKKVLHVYHTRRSHTITFLDSITNEQYAKKTKKFEESIDGAEKDVVATNVPDGYYFAGWYYESTCTTKADFTGQIMPPNDLVVYAKWEPIQYLVELDPNGGELAPDQRTWYFREYGGDPVEEYNTATRNYVPSVSGSYFYNYQGYDPAKPTNYGVAQYTEDINSGADLSVAYEYDPGNYAYAQWYEVDPVTGKESIYKFGEPVYHDTKLRLHWKELSTYFVRYDAGEGEIDGNDSNEDAFKNFDSSDYADHANVIISRTANAPDGFNFVGWKVKNDKNETIYYPGQHFEFRSEYATTEYDDNGKPKKYIVMEAVYLPIATATILYDANGGTIADDADLGKPSAASPILTPVYSNDGTVATVSNLLNNSGVQLSSGNGFVCTSKDGTKSYHFSGWNTEPDGSGTHFDASGQYYVDVYEPMTLYAEWEVNVYFDKANENASWGTAWGTPYQYDSATGRYYRTVKLHSVIEEPSRYPISSKSDETFYYWGNERYSQNVEKHDFSQPIEEETILYAYYRLPLAVPVHVADTSTKDVSKWNQDSTWRILSEAQVRAGETISFASAADTYTFVNQNKVSGYVYAFTCLSDSFGNISDDRAVSSVTYNHTADRVWVTFTDGTSEPLADNQEIYIVYYKHPKSLPISYVRAASSGLGTLTTLSVKTSGTKAPTTASIDNTGSSNIYEMSTQVKASPMTNYLSSSTEQNNNKFYSFAIGPQGAASIADLSLVTEPVEVGGTRPTLYVKDAWDGITYSLDGNTWYRAGDSMQLYVVYYPSEPVIVTLSEQTIGLQEDMSRKFTYTVVIEEYTQTITQPQESQTVNKKTVWYSKGDPTVGTPTRKSTNTITTKLSNGETEPFTLYRSITSEIKNQKNSKRNQVTTITYQTISIVQAAENGFVTSQDVNGEPVTENVLSYSYSTAYSAQSQSVKFTNVRMPIPIPIYVAMESGGKLVPNDILRSTDKNDNELQIDFDETIALSDTEQSGLFLGDRDVYAFEGIVLGKENVDGSITVLSDDITSVTYGQLGSETIYGNYLNHDKNLVMQQGACLYYVYYQMPKIVYVEETDSGLRVIQQPTRNQEAVSMNDMTVKSNIPLPLGDGLHFSQSGTGFRVPPNLDGMDDCSLTYIRIGVASGSSAIDYAPDKILDLDAKNGSIRYRFDSAAEWTECSASPTVYVVYKEIGYDLRITKKVVFGEDGQDFTLTIYSDVLENKAYRIGGYTSDTVTANNHTITLQILNGSDITIHGLPEGSYILKETDLSDDFTLTAEFNGNAETITDASCTVYLFKDSVMELTNQGVGLIPPTGYTESAAPYFAMLLMLLTFYVISKRSRKREVRVDVSSPI